MTSALSLTPVVGVGEVVAGDDLADLLLAHLDGPLLDGDVVVVTSKAVSKAAGLVVAGERADLVAGHTDRVVARRGATVIVRTHHGLTLAAAGLDASNTDPGTVVLLPPEPDASAAALRAALLAATGLSRLGVVVSDTAGRAWRTGQTDLAIGAAGLLVEVDHAGRLDPYGNPLAVTAPAVADEVAGAADLVAGKLAGVPAVVVRGLDPALFTDDDGPGARALVRAETGDLFGYGARDAVVAAARRGPDDVRGFPDTGVAPLDVARLAAEGVPADDLAVRCSADGDRALVVVSPGPDRDRALVAFGALRERLLALALAHRLAVRTDGRPLADLEVAP